MTSEEGRVIHGRYRISSRLGGGGMGTVWLAEDERIGRPVALKEIVLSSDGEDPFVQRERARREAQAAASVDHPGIVEIHDFFLDDQDRPWIVMEYVKGRTLADLILDGPLPEREVARIGAHMADAVAAVHARNVVHRDIKPTNIVINEAGEVFLVDFGIAHLAGRTRLTRNLIGTADYFAPEGLKDLTPGRPADLWALGVTLFYALEGRSPFLRRSIPATFHAILSEDPPPIHRPGLLADIIVRLLNKDPSRRMSAAELVLSLAAIGPRKPAPDSRERTARPTRSTADTARDVEGATAPTAARMLAGKSPQSARDVLNRIGRRQAAKVLVALPGSEAAAILAVTPSHAAGPLLEEMAAAPDRASSVMGMLSAILAGRALNYASRRSAAVLIAGVPVEEAVRILARTGIHTAAGIVAELKDGPVAGRLIEGMTEARAGNILRYLEPPVVAALLRGTSDDRVARLLGVLPPSARTQVRRHLDEVLPGAT